MKNIFKFLRTDLNSKPQKRLGFIVGSGRCGTTILSSLLNSHSKIVVPPELQFIDKLYNQQISQLNCEGFISIIRQFCPYNLEQFYNYRDYFNQLQYPQTNLSQVLYGLFYEISKKYNKEIFIEQTPWHGQHLPMLDELFPDCKVVHLVRDPRDVVISFIRSKWWGDITIKDGLSRWANIVNFIHDYGLKHPEKFIEIRYEDLVQQSKTELLKIMDLLQINFEEEMLDPGNLIDYRQFQKLNTLKLQSKEYVNWHSEDKKEVFFKDNVYGWQKNTEYTFDGLLDEIMPTMELFNYK